MHCFQARELSELLNGHYIVDFKPDVLINDFEMQTKYLTDSKNKNYAFISISNERWNQTHRKKTAWEDGNQAILSHYEKCKLIITEEPIEKLRGKLPQLIVDNSFEVLKKIAKAARQKMKNPVIGITGSVGKSSTRLMFEHLLKDEHKIVSNRGNHNTQAGVPLYGAKLCDNPDIGILEISLNALNNRGNQALIIQPDVCIVTSIGEAHLSTLHTTKNIAKFKARIFKGLTPGGLAVINRDIDEAEFEILYQAAKERTDRIKTYSMKHTNADLFLKHTYVSKYKSTVEFFYKNKDYSFDIKLPSEGIVQNALGVLLSLAEMEYDLETLLPKMENFQSLDRVMQLKQLETKDSRRVDILDDSHNAAIPSMINAIRTFKEKKKFYKGNGILVLGQVQDLGEQSEQLHQKLLPEILDSGFDYIFGHGDYMRKIIKQIPAKKVGGWFDNARDLSRRIPLYCSDDSLILLKGSVSGSDFQATSRLLPIQLERSNKKLKNDDPASIANALHLSYAVAAYDLKEDKKIYEAGSTQLRSIEGLSHIILLLLLLQKQIKDDEPSVLQRWATNKGVSINHKAFRTNTVFSYEELLAELMCTQHPSATFQLAHDYFGSRNKALKEIVRFAEKEKISPSATYNLTGRYRVKEQQSYGLEDLYKIGRYLHRYQSRLPDISVYQYQLKGITFGQARLSFIGFYNNEMICAVGVPSRDKLSHVLYETIKNIKQSKRVEAYATT